MTWGATLAGRGLYGRATTGVAVRDGGGARRRRGRGPPPRTESRPPHAAPGRSGLHGARRPRRRARGAVCAAPQAPRRPAPSTGSSAASSSRLGALRRDPAARVPRLRPGRRAPRPRRDVPRPRGGRPPPRALAARRRAPALAVAAALGLVLLAPLSGRRAPERTPPREPRAAGASRAPEPSRDRDRGRVVGPPDGVRVRGIAPDVRATPPRRAPPGRSHRSPLRSGRALDVRCHGEEAGEARRRLGRAPGRRRPARSGSCRSCPGSAASSRRSAAWVREDGASAPQPDLLGDSRRTRPRDGDPQLARFVARARDGPSSGRRTASSKATEPTTARRPAEAAERARLFRVSPGGPRPAPRRARSPRGSADGPGRRDPLGAAARTCPSWAPRSAPCRPDRKRRGARPLGPRDARRACSAPRATRTTGASRAAGGRRSARAGAPGLLPVPR